MARHTFGIIKGEAMQKILDELNGKRNGPSFRSIRFRSKGELSLPNTTPKPTTPPVP